MIKLSKVCLYLFLITSLAIISCKGRVPPPAPPSPTPAPSETPPPAEDPQPKTGDEFWKKMQTLGFTKPKDVIIADIKKQMALKITAWEKDYDQKTFDQNKANFNPPIKDLAEFQKKSLAFALRKDLDLYLDPTGSTQQTIMMKKLDSKTFEVIHITAKGTLYNYNQAKAAPKVSQLLFIPPDVYK